MEKVLDKESLQRRKKEQEEYWVSIVKKGKIPEKLNKKILVKASEKSEVARKLEFPELSTVELSPVKSTPMKELTRPRWSFVRPDAVMISVKSKEEFDRMYNKIESCSQSVRDSIRRLRRTRAGHLLIELVPGSNLHEAKRGLYDVMETGTEIKTLQKEFELEIKGIDPGVSRETVILAVANHLGVDSEDLKLKIMRETRAGHQVVVMDVPTKLIDLCMEKNSLKIGYSVVKMVPGPKLMRCFRCFTIGHYTMSYQVVLAGNMRCRVCGKDGHSRDTCTDTLRCMTCVERNLPERHLINSMACPVYRDLVNSHKDRFAKNFQTRKMFVKDKNKTSNRGINEEEVSFSDVNATPRSNIKNPVFVQGMFTPERHSKVKRKKTPFSEEDS